MSNRIIYYYQTFCGLDEIINQKPRIVSHIHLSSIHFGTNPDKTPYIHLNNYPPNNSLFTKVWKDTKLASELGIKIILMVGGAGGAYDVLFSNFEIYYELLKQTIKTYPWISGIDLDIEEFVDVDDVRKLIDRINTDFGENFIITMAPLASSLAEDILGMGGFIYKNLYNTKEGQRINWFNGQFYGNYNKDTYDAIIKNGYPKDKVVMGMLSSDFPGKMLNIALNEIKCIIKDYGTFGGAFVWEYSDCPPNKNNHSIWATKIHSEMNNNSKYSYFIKW